MPLPLRNASIVVISKFDFFRNLPPLGAIKSAV